jgi:tetratricopeptide (TPR) repeat protein
MSVIANVVCASSGTAKMSRMSRRVKPIEPAPIMAILIGLFIAGCMVTGGCDVKQDLPDFDKMWDYGDPAATETNFRELLPAAEKSGDISYHAQLLTQIARAQGLQDKFDEAVKTLDDASFITRDDMALAHIRIFLERGRVLNSSGQPEVAMRSFRSAWKWAEAEHYPRYAVDAVHMLAIAAPTPQEQIDWNLKALEMIENDPTENRWLPAVYNNLGESYARAGKYREALGAFRKLGDDPYALKDQSRMHRAMGRPGEALAIIEPVVQKQSKPDGWLNEEYAECLLALGREPEATPHFRVAYDLLKDDRWVLKNEPAKLERLRRLAGER